MCETDFACLQTEPFAAVQKIWRMVPKTCMHLVLNRKKSQ